MDEDAAFWTGIFMGALLCMLIIAMIAGCSSAFEDTDTHTQIINDTLMIGDDEYYLRRFEWDGAACIVLLDETANIVGVTCDKE